MTFSVYGDSRGTEKIFPFCLLPRLIAARDWAHLERGLQQRLRALGMFLDDIYGEQKILAAGVVPAEMVLGAAGYRPMLRGHQAAGRRAHSHLRRRSDPRSATARGACSRTTCARRRACRTSSRIAS